MEKDYYLYAVAGGWFSRSSTYTSSIADAQPFTRADAFAFAKNRSHTGELRYIPVSKADVQELLAK